MKALWMKRFFDSTKSNNLALHCMGIKDKTTLLHKFGERNYPKSSSKFHNQTVESWYKFYTVNPSCTEEILNERLVYNKNILIGGKMITPTHSFIKQRFHNLGS